MKMLLPTSPLKPNQICQTNQNMVCDYFILNNVKLKSNILAHFLYIKQDILFMFQNLLEVANNFPKVKKPSSIFCIFITLQVNDEEL